MSLSRVPRHAAPLLALALSGCFGGLLGGGKPVQQYRFGEVPADVPTAPDGRAASVLTLRPVHFAAEVDGDRILSATGAQTAYLKDARWVAPAPALFDGALRAALRARPGVLLTPRADGLGAGPLLSVDVSRFEVDYPSAGAAPTIRIRATAVFGDGQHAVLATRTFQTDMPASANAVSAVIAAFDGASAAMVRDIAEWAARTAATAPPPGRPAG